MNWQTKKWKKTYLICNFHTARIIRCDSPASHWEDSFVSIKIREVIPKFTRLVTNLHLTNCSCAVVHAIGKTSMWRFNQSCDSGEDTIYKLCFSSPPPPRCYCMTQNNSIQPKLCFFKISINIILPLKKLNIEYNSIHLSVKTDF